MIKMPVSYIAYDLSILNIEERRSKAVTYHSATSMQDGIGISRTHISRYTTRNADGKYPRYKSKKTGKTYAIRRLGA